MDRARWRRIVPPPFVSEIPADAFILGTILAGWPSIRKQRTVKKYVPYASSLPAVEPNPRYSPVTPSCRMMCLRVPIVVGATFAVDDC